MILRFIVGLRHMNIFFSQSILSTIVKVETDY